MILSDEYSNQEWRNRKLHYIGQAFGQTFKERISQPHPAYTEIKKFIKKKTAILFM
jgi:hypothetical protein